jgi:uridylate kinase
MDYIISLGGTIIVPDNISINFLVKFKTLICKRVKNGDRFIIVTGGGRTSRNYQIAGRALGVLKREDLDWLGIYSSRLNAHLLQVMFGDYVFSKVLTNPTHVNNWNTGILIVGGWKPGWSTDYVAVCLAKAFNINNVLNLSNIDYVYDKNPKEHADAKPLKRISWKDFRALIGSKWDPGLHTPFDPIAAILAENLSLKVIILRGTNLQNLSKLFNGKTFKGSLIHD